MKTLEVATDYTGIGAFEQALKTLKIKHKVIFACDKDKYARQTYAANNLTPFDVVMEKIGTLGKLSQGDWAGNFYFPQDVYNRKIPKKPLDVYVSTPPCQAFSLAGKREGENDKRGILFYNTHEFIKINNPRFFILENVKGLLSDDKGRTFNKWLDLLGGKTINGNSVIFPHEDSVPYHIYYKVLNAKHYGIPQNRERVFIIGIRDDADNNFFWPKPFPLTKTLKDVLETQVDDKYYLSENAINRICFNNSGFSSKTKKENDIASTIAASDHKITRTMNTLRVKSNTKQGFETCQPGDSINISRTKSKTQRGKVGKSIAQTLDTSCQQAVILDHRGHKQKLVKKITNGIVPTLRAESHGHQPKILDNYQIRKLTPRECLRLMGFPDTFKIVCSDTQTYKQAGNSVVVNMYIHLLQKLLPTT